MQVHHHSHRLTRLLAAGMAAAALAAPPAIARPIDGPNEPVRPDPVTPVEAPAPVVQEIDNGFDWGSAAVGAGAAGALVVVVALGGAAYAGRHRVDVAR
jgi:hypothetical protein